MKNLNLDTMKESLLSLIFHKIFGYKYYIVIYVNVGTNQTCMGGIFPTYKKAKASTTSLAAFIPIEIRSFRSHNTYNHSQKHYH